MPRGSWMVGYFVDLLAFYLQHFVGSYQALLKNNWLINLCIDLAVFHVQDEQGKKLRDQNVINCIQQVINVVFHQASVIN